MTRFFAIAALAVSATFANAMEINTTLELVSENQETNALVYDGMFDVYNIVAVSELGDAATSLELRLEGNFITAGGRAIKSGAALPVVFGQIAPDSFFVIPEGVNESNILAAPGTTEDTEGVIASSFTVSGDVQLIPGDGTPTVIATISVPAGAGFELPEVLGRAAVAGGFVPVFGVPEPSTAILAGLALVGFAARRNG